MSKTRLIDKLGTLQRLRSVEVERLQGELAGQEAVHQRYSRNLQRLDELCADSGASGRLPPALAANCGQYKEALIDMTATHRTDLALHEAELARTRAALQTAHARHEVLGMVIEKTRRGVADDQARRERKYADEAATQHWLRGKE
jgi:flagellar export protein FliJ